MKKEEIEKWEFHYLVRIAEILALNIEELKDKVTSGLSYLRHIYLPLVISSLQEKAYNPFSDVYEKHVCRLLEEEFQKLGMDSVVIGYGADLVLVAKQESHLIQIDTKTANEDNPSDFLGTIPLGINQFSYPGVIRLKSPSGYMTMDPVRVWPNLPTRYDGDMLNLTFGVLIIYPPYKEKMDSVRPHYVNARDLVMRRAARKLRQRGVTEAHLSSKPKNATKTKVEIIAENLIRALYIHGMRSEVEGFLELDASGKAVLDSLGERIESLVNGFEVDDILPSAIVVLSIPNGELVGSYDAGGEFVSGKSWGHSVRYHYKRGTFKEMEHEMPRVVIAYINPSRDDLKDLLYTSSNVRYFFDSSARELRPLNGSTRTLIDY